MIHRLSLSPVRPSIIQSFDHVDFRIQLYTRSSRDHPVAVIARRKNNLEKVLTQWGHQHHQEILLLLLSFPFSSDGRRNLNLKIKNYTKKKQQKSGIPSSCVWLKSSARLDTAGHGWTLDSFSLSLIRNSQVSSWFHWVGAAQSSSPPCVCSKGFYLFLFKEQLNFSYIK